MKVYNLITGRYALLVLVVLLRLNPVIGQSLNNLDVKNGFRDISFETHISAEIGMRFSATDKTFPQIKQYTRPADKLTLGQAELYDIIYSAYKGKLFGVRLEFDNGEAAKIFKALTEIYGEPTKSIPAPSGGNWSEYQWKAQKVTMVMSYTGLDNWVSITSNSLTEQIEKDKTNRISQDL